jgi:hypothetical protein
LAPSGPFDLDPHCVSKRDLCVSQGVLLLCQGFFQRPDRLVVSHYSIVSHDEVIDADELAGGVTARVHACVLKIHDPTIADPVAAQHREAEFEFRWTSS